jgi:hypothetical protein
VGGVEDQEGTVPARVEAEVRRLCLGLPETYEERAWVGNRWMVRKRNFAHLFWADDESTPSVAKAAAAFGPGAVLVFRSSGPELVALRNSGPPFFYAGWGRDVIAMSLRGRVDWTEVGELVTESYCVMAPQKLQALVDRPGT